MHSKLIPILCLLIVSCRHSIKTEGPRLDWSTDLTSASAAAKKEGRRVFLEFSTDWCPYCQYVKEKVFIKDDVARKMKQFILVRLDGDKAETQPLMDKFSVKGFPTFIIFDQNENELKRFNDINSSSEFIELLEDIEDRLPGHKELKEAKGLETYEAYKKAYDTLSKNDSKLEDALYGMLDALKEDKTVAKKYAGELIEQFPDSPFLPAYYKKLSELYSSDAVRSLYLRRAADIIEKRLAESDTVDERTLRITLDQHIDLLADIYKELKEFSKINPIYLKAAKLCTALVDKTGGTLNNRHMVSTIVYYYLNAGEPSQALDYLDRALKELPDYWPVYSSYAKVCTAHGEFGRAVGYAKKGYELAEDVAKPKLAFIWAEALAAQKDYKGATDVLKTAEQDLLKTGASEAGRAKKIISQIREKIDDYSSISL